MSDTTTTTTQTTTEAKTETSFAERVKAEVRHAGELGKAQWKDAFARTKKLLDEGRALNRAELEKAAGRVKDEVTQAVTRVKDEVTQAWAKVPVAKAQARGADLLLKVITPVRTFATTVEQSLVDARAAQASSETPGDQPITT